MSAIAGAVFADGREMSAGFLGEMVRSAAPRGFDGVSEWHSGPAGLIRFHHATTPEAVGEVQPLAGPSGAVIAFDGRLDNRTDLLALLGDQGKALASAPDAAIALALFEARGEAFLDALVGDWAIAIWRPEARRLFLARAPLGWRPLLWTFDGKTLGFATEPRALVLGLGLERRPNEGAAAEYLAARFVTRTDSFWQGVQRLENGGALTLENGRVRTWHWHQGPFEDLSHLSDDDQIDRFLELFDQALESATRSQTPVASHLSGGLDSSSIVARATELYRAGRLARPLNAITARFPGESQDETMWSSAVEQHIGVTTRVTSAEPYSLEKAGQWCADTLQFPVRPSVFDTTTATFRILRAEGSRVLLTGEGGDDWMAGGYGHFPDLLRAGRLGALWREALSQFPGERLPIRLRRTAFLTLAPIFSPGYRAQFLAPHMIYSRKLPDWFRPEWAKAIGLDERWRDPKPSVDLQLYAQKQRYSVFDMPRRDPGYGALLAYAEGQGVELRHPLHDLRLARFFMGVSGPMLRRAGEKKYILREAMRGTLPEIVRTRQDKAVFITSMVDAIAKRFRERPPETMLPAQLGWVDGKKLEAMFAPALAWREGGSIGPLTRISMGPLWFFVEMDMWLENAVRL